MVTPAPNEAVVPDEGTLTIGPLEDTPDAEATAEPVVAEASEEAPVAETVVPEATGETLTTEKAPLPDATTAPGVSDPALIALRQELAQMRQREIERTQQATRVAEEAELVKYKADLEAKGYEPEVIQDLVSRAAQGQLLQRQLAQAQEQARQNIAITVRNERARIIVAKKLSQEYGVPLADLLDIETDDPKDLIIAAQGYQMKANATKEEQAKVKPQRMAGVTGSAGRGTSRERLVDRYLENPESLTLEERKVVFPDRY